MMENHLIDTNLPEFGPAKCTNAFIYGSFDGEMIFYEHMITREFLLGIPQNPCRPIKQPQSFAPKNYYPTEYCMRYNQYDNIYTVSLEKFVAR